MKLFFKKAWLYAKKYWAWIMLGVGVFFAMALFRNRENSYLKKYRSIVEANDRQLAAMKAAHQEEIEKHKEAERKLRVTLEKIQKEYDQARKDLDDKKKEEIRQIVVKYGNDPVALAQQLHAATGFTIIMPEE
jgi:uncharacterized membrane protein YgaE (UPF0421/DUF939 family)